MRICVRVTAARTHSWMARYGSSDTAATPSIPSSRVKPIALVDARNRNRNRPSEASQIGTDITLAHCQHRVPRIGGAPQQKLGPFGNVRERPLPYRTHPPFLVLVQRQNAAVVRHVDVETDLDRAERIIRVLLLEPYSTMRGLEDMSVAGHDGSDVAASIKLTTMAQPARGIGRIAIGWPSEGTSDGTPADRVNKRINRFRIEKIEFFGFGGTLSMRFDGNCAPIYAPGFIR